ncbi:MAG: hypothetical protein WCT05_05025 [Lentisphaeria bacterium]
MDDKPQDSGKLRLRNTDTNRFKVDTGRLRVQPTPEAAIEISKQGAGETQRKGEFIDPISLRDTSTSKLKRLDNPNAASTTITPMSAGNEKKTETVRLKVVRAIPRPGTPPPTLTSAPLANVPLSAPAETEKPVSKAPQPAPVIPKVVVPKITLPPKPGETTNITAEYPQEPIVGDQVPPSAAKIDLDAKPAVSSTKGIATDTASLPSIAPAKPTATPEPVSSSTIKLSIKKPSGAALPPSGSSQPPAPAPHTPPPVETAPAAPALPSSSTSSGGSGLKIRPSATSGSTIATPPPAANSGQTAQVPPPATAGATVKVTPGAILPPNSGAKISLQKEPVKPEAASAEGMTPSSSTVTITPPHPETKAGSTGKGLKIRSSSAGKTVSVSPPGAAPKAPNTEGDSAAASEVAPSFDKAGHVPVAGITTLESISAMVATAALAVTLFSLIMSLLKQL